MNWGGQLGGRGGLHHTGRGGLGGIQDWADWGGRGGLVDWQTSGCSGLRNPGRGGLVDGVDWGGRGGGGRMGRTGWRGVYGSSLGRRKGRTRKPGAGVPADWADRLGCTRPGRLTSSHFRAEGILGLLSPDADCKVIWLHTPGIHIKFFRVHIVIIFFGTHTSKAQRASTGDKFFGSLGALNITYSMFIQMGHAIRNVVIVTYKGGLSSLVPPLPLCTSCYL